MKKKNKIDVMVIMNRLGTIKLLYPTFQRTLTMNNNFNRFEINKFLLLMCLIYNFVYIEIYINNVCLKKVNFIKVIHIFNINTNWFSIWVPLARRRSL